MSDGGEGVSKSGPERGVGSSKYGVSLRGERAFRAAVRAAGDGGSRYGCIRG